LYNTTNSIFHRSKSKSGAWASCTWWAHGSAAKKRLSTPRSGASLAPRCSAPPRASGRLCWCSAMLPPAMRPVPPASCVASPCARPCGRWAIAMAWRGASSAGLPARRPPALGAVHARRCSAPTQALQPRRRGCAPCGHACTTHSERPSGRSWSSGRSSRSSVRRPRRRRHRRRAGAARRRGGGASTTQVAACLQLRGSRGPECGMPCTTCQRRGRTAS
jgi:hypothetical protein